MKTTTKRNIPRPENGHKLTARDEFHRLISHYGLSFNTVSFNTRQRITYDDERLLGDLSRGVQRSESRFPIRRKYSARLTDPERPAMAYVAEKFPDHRLYRVDATLDYVTDDPPALLALFWRTVCQKWRGHQREMRIWQGTMHYWTMDQKGRNIGLYIKFRPELGRIVRLEIKTSSAELCRTRGMSNMNHLLCFDQDDLAALLDHEIKIAVFDPDKARQLIADVARDRLHQSRLSRRDQRKFGLDRAGLCRRYERRLCAYFHTEDGDIPDWEEFALFPAQAITDWMPFLHAAKLTDSPARYLIRA